MCKQGQAVAWIAVITNSNKQAGACNHGQHADDLQLFSTGFYENYPVAMKTQRE